MHKYTVIVQDYWCIRRVGIHHVETERFDTLYAAWKARGLASQQWGFESDERVHVIAVLPGHIDPIFIDPGEKG